MSSFIILARVATISPLSGDREVQVSVQSEKNFRDRQRVNGSAHLPASDKALDKKWSVQNRPNADAAIGLSTLATDD
jgi:hypothetical protein